MRTIKKNVLGLVFSILVISLFFNLRTANAEYTADIIWNGIEYKVVYSVDSDALSTHSKIYWATLDIDGNIIEKAPLIDSPYYSAENPTLIYTGIDYILVWVQVIPDSDFCRLYATIIDEYGNIIHRRIISKYITKGLDSSKDTPGTYTASWDDVEEVLYVVYSEGKFKHKNIKKKSSPVPERLVFSKLYRIYDKLHFVIRKKILISSITAYMKIHIVKINAYLAVIAGANLDSLGEHFILLNLNGEKVEKDTNNITTGELNDFLWDKLADMVDDAHLDLLRLANVIMQSTATETSNEGGTRFNNADINISDLNEDDVLNSVAKDNGYRDWNDMASAFNKFGMGGSMNGLTAGSPIRIQAIQRELQSIIDAGTSIAKTKSAMQKKIGQQLQAIGDDSEEDNDSSEEGKGEDNEK